MLLNNHRNILVTIVVSLFLIIAGCGDSSTDSGDDNNNNNNQNQSANFSSGPIAPGGTFSYTFEEEETVDYYCTIHAPNMTGQITVTSSTEATDRDTVEMASNQFVPENLEVAPNTEVVWVNNQDHDHDIQTGTPSSSDSDDPNY